MAAATKPWIRNPSDKTPLPSRAHPWLGPGRRHWERDTERVKPTFTLPMGDALRSWSPVMARDSQTWRLGLDFWVWGWIFGFGFIFFQLFATNGKSSSPHIRREKLGAGQGKDGQKAWKGGDGGGSRVSIISNPSELRSCRGQNERQARTQAAGPANLYFRGKPGGKWSWSLFWDGNNLFFPSPELGPAFRGGSLNTGPARFGAAAPGPG